MRSVFGKGGRAWTPFVPLQPGSGNDTLRGGSGNDRLLGGAGNDVQTGPPATMNT